MRAAIASARAQRRLSGMAAVAAWSAPPGAAARRGVAPQVGDPIGWLAIPRIGVRTVVVEGDDDLTLSFAAGHVPGTALPGAAGNVALAGHRDVVFGNLGRVRAGDLVLLKTPSATFRYTVESTRVVEPDDVEVLDPGARPTLTLVTCFPFRYIGAAPERFIVRARQLAGTEPKPAG